MDGASETSADVGDAQPWPSITYEQRPWVSSTDAYASRREVRSHRGPYRAAVPAEIGELVPSLDATLAAAVEDATTQIVRFDAENGDLTPFAPLLLRSESAASSQIENLTASAKAIASAELGDRSRPNASLVVANSRAMTAAIGLADDLNQATIIAMHAALLEETHPEWTGNWREEQVWIGGSAIGPHRADYVAPHHDRVPSAMADLVDFMDRDDLPVLVQAAISHAQFESIHPFPDGNGRIGRALVHALLRSKGTVHHVTVPISAGLLASRSEYFDSLDRYRSGDVRPIVERFVDAAHAAVDNGRRLTGDLRDVREGWSGRITARSDAAAWRLAARLTQQPVVNVDVVRRDLGVSIPTATTAIETLVAAGVLTQIGGGKRYRTWAAVEVLDALDAFAPRAGRRART